MNNKIKFNFVYTKDTKLCKEYLNTVPRNIDCINYDKIVNKLTKNDYYQYDPTDDIINSYLIKQLNSIFNNKKNVEAIYYTIKSLDTVVINNVKKFVNSLTDEDIEYNLHIDSNENVNNIKIDFNSIIKFNQ